jgi:DHA1 family multidrug/chloramphenicol efflux transport protein-like MFS transporter
MRESTLSYAKSGLNIRSIILTYKKILSNLPFMTSAASFGLLYGALVGSPLLPFYLSQAYIQPVQFGWPQLPVFGAYIVGVQMVKLLHEKIGKDNLILFGLSLALILGGLLILFSILYANKILSFVLPKTGYTLGFGFAAAPLNRTTLTATSEQKGAAIAIFYLTMTGAGTLISLILSIFDENALTTSAAIATSIFQQ